MNELVVDYILSLTNLLGIVPFDLVLHTYNDQNKKDMDTKNFNNIIEDKSNYIVSKGITIKNNEFISSEIILLNKYDYIKSNRREIPAYIPNRFNLLRYRNKEYFEKGKEYRDLYKLLKKYLNHGGLAEEVANKIGIYCMSIRGTSNIGFIFSQYRLEFDEKSRIEIQELIDELGRNSRRWELNGFTENELKEGDNQEKRP